MAKSPGGPAAVGQRCPALQWHLVAMREITPAVWALLLPAPRTAGLTGGVLPEGFFAPRGEGGGMVLNIDMGSEDAVG